MNALFRCRHWFGWSYNTYRRRRWCRMCGQQQRRMDSRTTVRAHVEAWVNVGADTPQWPFQ